MKLIINRLYIYKELYEWVSFYDFYRYKRRKNNGVIRIIIN